MHCGDSSHILGRGEDPKLIPEVLRTGQEQTRGLTKYSHSDCVQKDNLQTNIEVCLLFRTLVNNCQQEIVINLVKRIGKI